jgi:DNA excision repair protein ERCC-4
MTQKGFTIMETVILVDTRERLPLKFQNLKTLRSTLKTADYSVLGYETVFGVERKTMSDLVGSLTQGRARFMAELYRLQRYQFKRLLVIGSRSQIEKGDYRSACHPAAILASLNTIEVRFDIPITYVADETEAALVVEGWARYWMREQDKRALEAMNTPAETEANTEPLEGLLLMQVYRDILGTVQTSRPDTDTYGVVKNIMY